MLPELGNRTVHVCRQIRASCPADSSRARWCSRPVRPRRPIGDSSERRRGGVRASAGFCALGSRAPSRSASAAPGRTDARPAEPSSTSWSNTSRSRRGTCTSEPNCYPPPARRHFSPENSHFTHHFSGSRRAIGSSCVWVCVCVSVQAITCERDHLWSTYLARPFVLILSRSSSKVKSYVKVVERIGG